MSTNGYRAPKVGKTLDLLQVVFPTKNCSGTTSQEEVQSPGLGCPRIGDVRLKLAKLATQDTAQKSV
jgi:hypothetical protein